MKSSGLYPAKYTARPYMVVSNVASVCTSPPTPSNICHTNMTQECCEFLCPFTPSFLSILFSFCLNVVLKYTRFYALINFLPSIILLLIYMYRKINFAFYLQRFAEKMVERSIKHMEIEMVNAKTIIY